VKPDQPICRGSEQKQGAGNTYIVAVLEERRQVLCTGETLEIRWASDTLGEGVRARCTADRCKVHGKDRRALEQ